MILLFNHDLFHFFNYTLSLTSSNDHCDLVRISICFMILICLRYVLPMTLNNTFIDLNKFLKMNIVCFSLRVSIHKYVSFSFSVLYKSWLICIKVIENYLNHHYKVLNNNNYNQKLSSSPICLWMSAIFCVIRFKFSTCEKDNQTVSHYRQFCKNVNTICKVPNTWRNFSSIPSWIAKIVY